MPRGRPRKSTVAEKLLADLRNDVEDLLGLLDENLSENPRWWFGIQNRIRKLSEWLEDEE